MLLPWPMDSFQLLPLLPTSKLGPFHADSQIGGFVYVLGPCGSLQWTLLWGWEFLPLLQLPQVFTARSFEGFFFPCFYTGLCGLPYSLVIFPYLCAHKFRTTGSSSHHLSAYPLCPGCLYPPLLPVRMNVSSLSPWLFDFHTVLFSNSSGYFCY